VWASIPAVSFALATFIFERWVSGHAKAEAKEMHVVTTTAPETSSGTVLESAPESAPEVVVPAAPVSAVETVAAPVSRSTRKTPVKRTRGRSEKRSPGRSQSMTGEQAQERFADVLAVGELPSLREIKRACHVGAPKAQEIHDHLERVRHAQTVAAVKAA
jgi:hypothetical protein